MQMILIQTEIEEAIRDYVNNQVNVREGMRIDIDLSATRGPEGFKATIDIVRDDAPASSPTLSQVTSNTSNQPETDDAAPTPTPTSAPKIRKAAPPKEASQPGLDKPESTEVDENAVAADPVDTSEDAEETAPESEEQSEDAPAPKAARSLFSNLTKPVNS